MVLLDWLIAVCLEIIFVLSVLIIVLLILWPVVHFVKVKNDGCK